MDHALKGKKSFDAVNASVKVTQSLPVKPTEAEFLGWLRYGNMDLVRVAWKQYGKAISGAENLFSVVLFLARDKSLYAKEAYELYSTAYPNDPRLKMISQFFE